MSDLLEPQAARDTQPPLHHLFLALLPPPAQQRRIAAERDRTCAAKSLVRDDRLHMTLFILPFLPAVPRLLVEILAATAAALMAEAPEVVLDRVSTRGGSTALVPSGRAAGLRTLVAELESRLGRHGIMPGRRFNPHVTLAYDVAEPANGPIAPISWRASEVVLIDSHIGQTRHELLGWWPLFEQPLLL